MDYLPKAAKHLVRIDPQLKVLFSDLSNFVYSAPASLFVELVSSIISQQLSVKVARIINDRFLCLFPDKTPSPSALLSIPHESLRAIGLSNNKVSYVKNVGEYFLDASQSSIQWEHLSDQQIIEALTVIKGVGVWTVQMQLIFTLHRTDVWPIDDLGVQQGFAKLLNLDIPTKLLKKEMEKYAEKWQPYRSAVALGLWKFKDKMI